MPSNRCTGVKSNKSNGAFGEKRIEDAQREREKEGWQRRRSLWARWWRMALTLRRTLLLMVLLLLRWQSLLLLLLLMLLLLLLLLLQLRCPLLLLEKKLLLLLSEMLLLLLLLKLELLDRRSGPLLHWWPACAGTARDLVARRRCSCCALSGLNGLHLAQLGGRHAPTAGIGRGGCPLGEGLQMGCLLLSRGRGSRDGRARCLAAMRLAVVVALARMSAGRTLRMRLLARRRRPRYVGVLQQGGSATTKRGRRPNKKRTAWPCWRA